MPTETIAKKPKYSHAIPEFDPSVIIFAQQGDLKALDAIARGCLPFAQWAARRYLATFPHQQDDGVQAAFVGAPFAYNSKGKSSGTKFGLLQRLKQFDPTRGDFQRFAAVQIITAVRAFANWELKHTRDRANVDLIIGPHLAGEDDAELHLVDYVTGGHVVDYESNADTLRNASALRAAFNSLRPEYQQVLTLTHTEPAMTMREVAEHLTSTGNQISFQGVHLRYKAAVKELKKLVKQVANVKKAA